MHGARGCRLRGELVGGDYGLVKMRLTADLRAEAQVKLLDAQASACELAFRRTLLKPRVAVDAGSERRQVSRHRAVARLAQAFKQNSSGVGVGLARVDASRRH